MRKHFKSRFPAFNIPRRSEEVATDTIFSDTPAIDSGVTMAQIFVGKRTLVTDVYPLKSQKQFVNTLEDNIRFRGAMTKLISDYAKVEISNKVKDILRMYHSSSWNSEPYHQNRAEGRYCTLKSWTNTIMNRSGAPADCWLLCDRIPSTTPGAEPPRDAKDSGSARSHSTHLETSSSNRP